MTITLRSNYISEPNKYDIPIAYKPLGTLPGDFMLMRIITLNEREPVPVVPGWSLVVYDYQQGVSQFIFSKIDDNTDDKYTVIRKKTGINYIQVYSWFSEENNEILLDPQTILVPSSFKHKRNRSFNISEYSLDYNNNQIQLTNGSVNAISFTLKETSDIYRAKITAPAITEAIVNADNSVSLKWNGIENYTVEMSQDGKEWQTVTNELVDNSYITDSLLPSTRYYFRVYATKDTNISMPSNSVDIKTYDKIALRSATYNNAGTINPHIVVSPPGIQKGDLLIMQVSYMPNMKIMKLSQGWKLLHEYKNSDVCCNIYYKIATRKEPGSYFVQHNGVKNKKMLLAVAAFHSPAGNLVRVANSAIQYNPESNYITFPPLALESVYSLGIGLSVRPNQSSLRLPVETTIMWDIDKNLRTTGIFKGYNNTYNITPDPIYANPGLSISATIALVEKEIVDVPAPNTPTGLRAKRAGRYSNQFELRSAMFEEEFPYHTFLPFIEKSPLKNYDCDMTLGCYIFTTLWSKVLGDRAKRMKCSYKLVKAAQKHAEYLSSRTIEQEKLSMHIGRDGTYPNERARAEGYRLPEYYDDNTNNIESCYRGSDKPEHALERLLASPPHYNHITGQGWFVEHIIYGVGNSVNDWVVLVAPVE